jgi:hypothetical protein
VDLNALSQDCLYPNSKVLHYVIKAIAYHRGTIIFQKLIFPA